MTDQCILTKKNTKADLNRPVEFWKNVLWSDVTKLELFGLLNQQYSMSGAKKAKLMSRRTASARSNTEEKQSCYGELYCCRKWNS